MFILSACPSVCSLVCELTNCRKYCTNVFKFMHAVHIECTILKMVCMGLNVHLQRREKFGPMGVG